MSSDSILQGIESHADFGLTSQLFAEVGLDYVRGTLRATDQPLPRIPPLRGQVGLRYQRNAFQIGGEPDRRGQAGASLRRRDADGRISVAPAVCGLLGAGTARRSTPITARLDNVTDELYRNHLSLIKDLAPEMGRNFKLLYNVKF